MILLVGAAVVVGSCVLLVALLTAIGAHRRGTRLSLSVFAGAVFPVTWTGWYAHDALPYHRTHPHHGDHT